MRVINILFLIPNVTNSQKKRKYLTLLTLGCNWEITYKTLHAKERKFNCIGSLRNKLFLRKGLQSILNSVIQIPRSMLTHWTWRVALPHWGWDKARYLLSISSCFPAPTSKWIIKQDCRPASWPTQLRLSLSGSLLPSISVNGHQATAQHSLCQVGGFFWVPLTLHNRACLKRKFMFRFTGAWHLPALSQPIKIDEVFITDLLLSGVSKDDRHLSRVDIKRRKRVWVSRRKRSVTFTLSYTIKNTQESQHFINNTTYRRNVRDPPSSTSLVNPYLGNDVIWSSKLILI